MSTVQTWALIGVCTLGITSAFFTAIVAGVVIVDRITQPKGP